MITKTPAQRITVSGMAVDVVRKDIKNLHLGVYPPLGRVRVAAPLVVSDEAVRLAVINELIRVRRSRRFSRTSLRKTISDGLMRRVLQRNQ